MVVVVDTEHGLAHQGAHLGLLGVEQGPASPASAALAVMRTLIPSIPLARKAMVGLPGGGVERRDARRQQLGQTGLAHPPGPHHPARDDRRLARRLGAGAAGRGARPG